MKAAIAFVATAFFASSVIAAEYGVGLSAKSDDGWIYFPIDVSKKFRVEPHIRYATADSESDVEFFGSIVRFRSESESLEVGLGLFGLASPKESVRIYYGGRLGYFEGESESTIFDDQLIERETSSSDGYRIAPTLGFEYLFSEHFSLGGEVAYFFEDRNGEFNDNITQQDFEGDRSGTQSFLILRYFF